MRRGDRGDRRGAGQFVDIARTFLEHGDGRIRIRGDHNRIAIAQPARLRAAGGRDRRRLGASDGPTACWARPISIWSRRACWRSAPARGQRPHPHLPARDGRGTDRAAVPVRRRVEMTVSDMHSTSFSTGSHRPPRDVTVGDGVWLGGRGVAEGCVVSVRDGDRDAPGGDGRDPGPLRVGPACRRACSAATSAGRPNCSD